MFFFQTFVIDKCKTQGEVCEGQNFIMQSAFMKKNTYANLSATAG
jgi:hypothetical protein